MELYREVTKKIDELLGAADKKQKPYCEDCCAKQGEKDAILFRDECALELGGSGRSAVSTTVFCPHDEVQDEVLLYGKDLKDLTEDPCFAHITYIGVKAEAADFRYEQLKEIGFTVYQLYPQGYHIRMSPTLGKEQVRVSKKAIQGGLSFYEVGCLLIQKLKQNPCVQTVRTVFITQESFDYKALGLLAQRVKKITDAVESSLQLDELDCAHCAMKPVCDEVEGLRELHFKNSKGG